jgi:hypothetical protein
MEKSVAMEKLEEMCPLNQEQIRMKVDGNAELLQILEEEEEELYCLKEAMKIGC